MKARDSNLESSMGIGSWFILFLISNVLVLISGHWYYHLGFLFALKIKNMLIGVIYKKIHSLTLN